MSPSPISFLDPKRCPPQARPPSRRSEEPDFVCSLLLFPCCRLSKEAIESLKLSILEREKEEAEKKQAKLEEEAKIEALKRQQDLAINLHSLQEIAGVTWNSKQAVESLIDREKDN